MKPLSGRGNRNRVKSVPKLYTLELLGLALSEKEIPQRVENIRNVNIVKLVEAAGVEPASENARDETTTCVA
jgi:hypothetical protein